MKSGTSSQQVRDYIYLDTNRAKSIYSQLRRGLLQSYICGNETSESSSEGVDGRKQTVEQSVLLGTSFEATHVLHDFIYTVIEEDLSDTIKDIQSSEHVCDLQPGDYFRICGRTQIDDTSRFLRILKDINMLCCTLTFQWQVN